MVPTPRTRPDPDPETALLAAARRGEVAAFEGLYRIHAGRIHAICLRLSGDASVAEELTQEAFVRAWQRVSTLRGDAFGAWLRRLAVNTALDDRRSHARRLARVMPQGDPGAQAGCAPTQGMGMDLERAIAALPPKARHVFVLREIEGLTHAEVAQLTGVTEGTSKGQLHRARQLLREILS